MKLNNSHEKVIEYATKGYSNIEIAQILGYSPDTIKKKLCQIYKYYKVTGRIDLVNYILKKAQTES